MNVEEEEEKQAPKSLPSTGRHEYHQNLKSQVADVARGHSAGLQRKSSACVGAVEQVVMMVAPWSRGFS